MLLAVYLTVVLSSLGACQSGSAGDPAARGQQLSAELGCSACHSVSGAQSVGPTWKGLYGRAVRLADGRSVTADEAYLTEKLRSPGAAVVEGYPSGVMVAALQSIRPQLDRPENVRAIVEYIKTLK